MYKQLVQHRNELDGLLTSLASGMHIVSSGMAVKHYNIQYSTVSCDIYVLHQWYNNGVGVVW